MTFGAQALKCLSLTDLATTRGEKQVILAGIDEAGYGPRLGPLVVAGSALRTARESADASHWPVSRFLRHGAAVTVADSKKVYSRSRGLSGLEKAVFAFVGAPDKMPVTLADFLTRYAAEGALEAQKLPWYSCGDCILPREISTEGLATLQQATAVELSSGGLSHVWSAFCVVDENRYNDLLLRTGNKAMILFGRAAILMRRLWDEYAGEGVYLTVDRQGGRKFYAGLLDMVFPDAAIGIFRETENESAYVLTGRDGRGMHVRFVVRAEESDSCVALSSMWAKYVREIFMHMLNEYWTSRAAEVRPTAGYWEDAERFIADLRSACVMSDAEAERIVRWK